MKCSQLLIRQATCIFFALNAIAATASAGSLARAEDLLNDGNVELALTEVDAVLQDSPDSISARFLKARTLYALGSSKDAMKIYLSLIEEPPVVPEAYINLSVYYAEQGRPEIARDLLVEAINAQNSCQLAYQNLSRLNAGMAGRAYQLALSESGPAVDVPIPPLQVAHLSTEAPLLIDYNNGTTAGPGAILSEAEVIARIDAETARVAAVKELELNSRLEVEVARLEREHEADVAALVETRSAQLETEKEVELKARLDTEVARLQAEQDARLETLLESRTVLLGTEKEAELDAEMARLQAEQESKLAELVSAASARMESDKETEILARLDAKTARLSAEKEAEFANRLQEEVARLESEKEKEILSRVETQTIKLKADAEALVVAQLEAETEATEKEVEATIKGWAKAWSAVDIESYLAYYSTDFKPSKGTRVSWEKQRRDRFRKSGTVSVDISEVQVFVKRKKALANFRQNYQSDTFRDEVQKTLILVATDDGWKILHEVAGN